ncbi:MAG: orotidine-5'-phosphate decarboxylase [Myxococcota bacterium]
MSLPRVFVALDLDSPEHAVDMAQQFEGIPCGIKIGSKLFTAGGPSLILALRQRLFPIFLDLKYHDIPEVVAGAVREATKLRVQMLTVHASGGRRMMQAAQQAAREEARALSIPAPMVLAVSVLTSLSAEEVSTLGWPGSPAQVVERLARLAAEAGVEGLVCSPLELELLRSLNLPLRKLTPGIRLSGPVNAHDDQVRTATPEQALAAGADWLVIGRPITTAPDPALALRQVLARLDNGA